MILDTPVSDELTAVNAWSSSYLDKALHGPQLAWRGDSSNNSGFFHSNQENNPWLRIQLNKPTTVTSVTIINRKDCCGERLKNLELRGGMKNDLTNPVIGEFKGPGKTKGVHHITLEKPTKILYLTFQLKMNAAILQVNGIRLNTKYGENSVDI